MTTNAILIMKARAKVSNSDDINATPFERLIWDLAAALEQSEQKLAEVVRPFRIVSFEDDHEECDMETARLQAKLTDQAVIIATALDVTQKTNTRVIPDSGPEGGIAQLLAILASADSGSAVQAIKAEALSEAAEVFHSRLPDGTGNGRAYNSYTVAAMLYERARAITDETEGKS